MKTTVCVLTMNRVKALVRCVDSLFPAIQREDARLYVLDQASGDGTDSFLAFLEHKLAERVAIWRSPVNLGCAGGRDALARRALSDGADVVVFVDDDTYTDYTDWLADLTGPVVEGALDVAGVEDWLITDDYQAVRGAPADYVSGGRCAIARRVFEAGVAFDPRFNPNYWEDVDLCFQARAQGFRVGAVRVCRLDHDGHPGDAAAAEAGRLRFMAKWPRERIDAAREGREFE